MTTARKRRKVRNPRGKVSRVQKNPKRISLNAAHPIIQKHWDKKLTLRENYERLGLLANIDGPSGGIPRREATQAEDEDADMEEDVAADEEMEHTAEDGSDDEEVLVTKTAPIGKKISTRPSLAPVLFAADITAPIPNATTSTKTKFKKKNPVVEEMEEAALNAHKEDRRISEQEDMFLVDLVAKHGDNFEAMARDKKLNPHMLSAGQLKRKLKRKTKIAAS